MSCAPDMLRTVTLFSRLTEDELGKFGACTETALFAPHQTIYRAGDTSGAMYMILGGRVRISLSDRYGREIIIAQRGAGEPFGTLPDARTDVCSDTAVTLVATRLIVLDRINLGYLFSVKPDSALMVIGALEAHLRRLHSLIRKSKLTPLHRYG